jgi:hypothetical protein
VLVRGRQPGKPNGHINGRYSAVEGCDGRVEHYICGSLVLRFVPPAPGSEALRVDESFKCDEGSAEIYVSADSKHVYNVTLTLRDEGNINRFYLMQLIKHGSGCYSIFKRSGAQVGKAEEWTSHFNEDFEAAQEAFEHKFLHLTGQDFMQEEEFAEIPGKYTVQELQAQPRKRARVEKEISKTLPYVLQHFLELIFDESLVDDELDAMAVDKEKLPFGNFLLYYDQHVQPASAALEAIGEELLQPGAMSVERRERLREKTAAFYAAIPHLPARPALAPEVVESADQLDLLTQRMLDLCRMLNFREKSNTAKQCKTNDEALADAQYAALGVALSPVPKEARSYLLIKNALETTQDKSQPFSLSLVDLLQYPVQGAQLPANGARKCLLWHGARLSSWVGLISQGLKSSGKISGDDGLSFFDAVLGSAVGCAATPARDEGLLLLSEVDLSNVKDGSETESPEEGGVPDVAVRYSGRATPSDFKPLGVDKLHPDNGVEVPLGPLEKPEHLQMERQEYNKYVVSNLSLVQPRFLARVKFTFADESALR